MRINKYINNNKMRTQKEKEILLNIIEMLNNRNKEIIAKEKEKSINQEYQKFMQDRKIKHIQ